MGTSDVLKLRQIAQAVKRQVARFSPFEKRHVASEIMRDVAALIRQGLEHGLFFGGPYAQLGDEIRPKLVVTNTLPMADGLESPLWVQEVWFAVVNKVAPELFRQRLERIKAAVGHGGMSDLAHDLASTAKVNAQDKEFLRLIAKDTSYLPTKAEVLAVANAIDAEAGRIEREGRRKPRVTVEEANPRAREALKGRAPKGKRLWTVRLLAHAIGCSEGLVGKLPAWQAYQDKHPETRRKSRAAPKAVALTEKTLAEEDSEVVMERLRLAELANTAADQIAEGEADRRSYRRRRKV